MIKVLIGRIGRVIKSLWKISCQPSCGRFSETGIALYPTRTLALITGVVPLFSHCSGNTSPNTLQLGRILDPLPKPKERIHKRARKKSVASQQFRLHWWQHWQLFWRTILASQRRKRSERQAQGVTTLTKYFLSSQVSLFCWAVSYFSINCGKLRLDVFR